MTDDELEQFIVLLKSFMDHASVEELCYLRRESTRKCNETYYKRKAKECGVSMDYYMKEFLV
jgi:hypothetical protein